VFVVEENIAHRRPVVTGYAQNGFVEITDGLVDGEQIVTIGQAGLKQGAKVTVINAMSNEESAANNTQPSNQASQ
jgi:multidrug efflux pump subunit AcrA (membrane-fusion protein)